MNYNCPALSHRAIFNSVHIESNSRLLWFCFASLLSEKKNTCASEKKSKNLLGLARARFPTLCACMSSIVIGQNNSKLVFNVCHNQGAKRPNFGQWSKKIKDAVVCGCGCHIFPKSPKESRNSEFSVKGTVSQYRQLIRWCLIETIVAYTMPKNSRQSYANLYLNHSLPEFKITNKVNQKRDKRKHRFQGTKQSSKLMCTVFLLKKRVWSQFFTRIILWFKLKQLNTTHFEKKTAKQRRKYRRFHGRGRHLGSGANAAKFTVNVWEKSWFWCSITRGSLTFYNFYELQTRHAS